MKEMDRNVLSAAFHVTIPVLMGYLAIGMAFGLMMDSAGYNVFWALLMSLIIYAGAGQYMGVTLLAAGASPLQTALMTLLLNFRHMFYGLSMLEKFRGMGLRKLYMIFSLTDETYALLASAKAPEGVRAQAAQALRNLDTALRAGGANREDVVMCRVYLPDVAYWGDLNEEYGKFFGEHKPARVVVPTNRLYGGCLVEIEAVAQLKQ